MPQMVAQLKEVPKIVSQERRTVEQAVLFATVAKTIGEARPLGIAKNSTTTEAPSGEAVPSWPEADGTTSADDTESAVTERELAKSSGGVGPSWSRANGRNSAAAVADVKSAGGREVQRHFRIRVRTPQMT